MSKWIEAFKEATEGARIEYDPTLEWRFGPPAAPMELDRLRQHLRAPIPSSLQELLSEANGIEILDETWGEEWEPLYFSVEQMLTDVVDYLETSGNPMPPAEELQSVVFFSHQNGFACLNAICVRSFLAFNAGDVVCLEHDCGEWTKVADSLDEFLLDPCSCCL